MQRFVWLTDIHLNFLRLPESQRFVEQVAELTPDAVLFTGDLSESPDVIRYLELIDQVLECPFYFVLGNHDFYFGSIQDVRNRVQLLCGSRPKLVYLTMADHFRLTSTRGIVGHDGWADARIGDYERSLVMMNDYKLIRELAGYNKQDRWPVLQRMGDEAASHVRRVLTAALEHYSQVMLLTHVPPLREACWHQDQISNDEWAPHFTCKAVGEVILEIMKGRPDRHLTVLCGHTHGSGETRPLPNVEILTGGAEYGKPEIVRTFVWDD